MSQVRDERKGIKEANTFDNMQKSTAKYVFKRQTKAGR